MIEELLAMTLSPNPGKKLLSAFMLIGLGIAVIIIGISTLLTLL